MLVLVSESVGMLVLVSESVKHTDISHATQTHINTISINIIQVHLNLYITYLSQSMTQLTLDLPPQRLSAAKEYAVL